MTKSSAAIKTKEITTAKAKTKKKVQKTKTPRKDRTSVSKAGKAKISIPYDSAEWTYRRLTDYINDFEKTLDDEHEVGTNLVTAEGGTRFQIDDMGYWDPDMITFDGTTGNGERVRLIQHTSQLNVVLIAMKKPQPKIPPRRIGFNLAKKIKKK